MHFSLEKPMKKILGAVSVALFSIAPLSGAQAVDVFNEDAQSYVVFYDTEEDSFETPISAGESIANLCKACDIYVNEEDEPIEAKGKDVVVIRNGKVSLEP